MIGMKMVEGFISWGLIKSMGQCTNLETRGPRSLLKLWKNAITIRFIRGGHRNHNTWFFKICSPPSCWLMTAPFMTLKHDIVMESKMISKGMNHSQFHWQGWRRDEEVGRRWRSERNRHFWLLVTYKKNFEEVLQDF